MEKVVADELRRRKIFIGATETSTKNAAKEANTAHLVHLQNHNKISELYLYHHSKIAIEAKTEEVRENIDFKIEKARYLYVTNFYKGWAYTRGSQMVPMLI